MCLVGAIAGPLLAGGRNPTAFHTLARMPDGRHCGLFLSPVGTGHGRYNRAAMADRCIVYLADGQLCGKPATILDKQRGGLVCVEHARDRAALQERFNLLQRNPLPDDQAERDRVFDEQDRIEFRIDELLA